MTSLHPLPASRDADARGRQAPHPARVAAAHRRLHEAQVELSTGTPCSAEADGAEAAYRDAVADAFAESAARRQEVIAAFRGFLLDETGDRASLSRVLCDLLDAEPHDTAAALADLAGAVKDARREVASLAVEVLDCLTRTAALESATRAEAGVRP